MGQPNHANWSLRYQETRRPQDSRPAGSAEPSPARSPGPCSPRNNASPSPYRTACNSSSPGRLRPVNRELVDRAPLAAPRTLPPHWATAEPLLDPPLHHLPLPMLLPAIRPTEPSTPALRLNRPAALLTHAHHARDQISIRAACFRLESAPLLQPLCSGPV